MENVKFGGTGPGVSRLCVECMTHGVPSWGPRPWTLDEEKSRPLIKQALNLGINFFDILMPIPMARRRKSSAVR
jgi:1-deoxyxylulose-5-phosphate synthase